MATIKKYALVLSGGGFKGAFQVGALQYLMENGIQHTGAVNKIPRFDFVSGVSAGAINGALMAMDKFDALKAFWTDVEKNGAKEIMVSDIVESNLALRKGALFGLLSIKGFFQKIFLGILPTIATVLLKYKAIKQNIESIKSLASNDPLRKKLQQVVKKSDIPPGVTYTCGFVSLVDGQYYSYRHHDFTNDEELVKGIVASSGMPAIFPPVPEIAVNVANKPAGMLVDGGIRNVSPMKDVIQLIEQDMDKEHAAGRDVEYFVIIINNHSDDFIPEKDQYKQPNFFKVAMRSLNEVALKEIFNNDIKLFEQINELVLQAEQINAQRGIANDDAQAFRLVRKAEPGKPVKYYKAIHYKIIQPKSGDYLGSNLLTEEPDPSGDGTTLNLIKRRREIGFLRAKEAMDNLNSSKYWK